jgi:hypothetical protein
MKKRTLDKLLSVAGGVTFIWQCFAGEVRPQSFVPPQNYEGCRVPITRQMTTTNGVNFGWLYDKGLVKNLDSRGLATSSKDFENAANEDSDNDGLSNAEEYAWGTNPSNSNDVPRIEFDRDKKSLSWKTSSDANWKYVVQKSTNLVSGVWQDVKTNACTETSYDINDNSPKAFYKVEARYKK